jgi:nicotinate-nucleotide adenylyltransferase
MKRIGLLGGSFNPAHDGHRRISLAALETLALDELWWLVSPGNPLKAEAADMAPIEARLRSAEKVAAGSRIKVLDFEREAGTRYTVDTLAQLIRRYPRFRFIWIMGEDTLPNFHLWRSWRQIARLVPIAVIPRPGYARLAHAARAMGWLRRFVRPERQARHWTKWSAPAIFLLRLPPDPASATALRALDPHWHRKSAAPPRRQRTGRPFTVRRPLARSQ